MREYTTLGTGKSTKILDTATHREARTVTTCSHDAAKAAALALGRTDRQLAAALYDLAVRLNGQPVEARRHLLAHFDANLTEDTPGNGDAWRVAEQLTAAVATAVRGEPTAVITTVRAELHDHLEGFDGVLIPARIVAGTHKRAKLDLVISGPLTWAGDEFWDGLLGAHGHLDVGVDDDVFPVGGNVVSAVELYDVLRELEDAESLGTGFTDFSVLELHALASEDEPPELLVRTDHLAAWVDHHRPEDLETVRSALQL